ncbi:methyl-accepting chemotaxis protein [Desulfocucumis palustris]|uniref:Methyl-accepting chemotaxis protein n=1 Tax=Desulfocucumis palustris TaxID=1898651 RepID=A0A2L2XBV0_9FIRM|nr:methyl-accepting chemotaxis protein [Desulfocucumis palustris]GBF33698.1 methyl-accepting chemotaxis protein [Desulfocucumis palustris]
MRASVRMRIGGGFTTLLVLLAIIAVVASLKMNTTEVNIKDIGVNSERISLDYQIKESFQEAVSAIWGYMLYNSESYLNQYNEKIKITENLISERINNSSEQDRSKFEIILVQVKDCDQQVTQNMVPLLREDKLVEATALGTVIAPITTKVNKTLDESISENEQKSNQLHSVTETAVKSGRVTINVVGIIALLIAALLSFFITRSITGPVRMIMSRVQPMAAGDFTHTVEINRRDELGELAGAINRTREQLRELVSGIVIAAQSVAAHSEELAASAEEVNATVEEVASATGEVAAMAEKSMENASTTAEGSRKVVEVAQSGSGTVQRTVEKINAIARASGEANSSIQKLGQLSAKVGNITDVITGIAEQTNLLALNAAIEAARAGEQGRGFAVVADEVRKLAEQSASAAGEIGQLIQQIQAGVEDSMLAMEYGAAEVKEGVHLASEAGAALDSIIVAINSSISLVEEIALVTRQTGEGTQRLSEGNEQVSTTIQQVVGSTQELADIATGLRSAVNRFKV